MHDDDTDPYILYHKLFIVIRLLYYIRLLEAYMSKKIQVVISDSMYDVVETVCAENHFNNISDFVRECIRYYIHRSPNTAVMEEEIRKLLYGLPLDEQIIVIEKKLKELDEFKRELVLKE